MKRSILKINSIIELAEREKLADGAEEWLHLFRRIYHLSSSVGHLVTPPSFQPLVAKWFSMPQDKDNSEAIARAQEQTVVKVFDKWTYSQTVFNAARACRPLNNNTSRLSEKDEVKEPVQGCDFCFPLEMTAEDTWGRLENRSCVTASNVAKYDSNHGMIVFKKHSPLDYSKEKMSDILDLSVGWFKKTCQVNPEAVFPIFNWNCKPRAGASQHHGHAHVLLGESVHYGHFEALKRSCQHYTTEYPGKHYNADKIHIHKDLGLAKTVGDAVILIPLTPVIRYEMTVVSWNYGKDFKNAVHTAMESLLHSFGSVCFNVCIQFPPLEKGDLRPNLQPNEMFDAKGEPLLPYVAHFVDRGHPEQGATSDLCSFNLFGSSVVPTDPFKMAQLLGWS